MEKKKGGQLIQNKIIVIIFIIIVAAIVIAFGVTEYIRSKSVISEQDCYNSVVVRSNALARGEITQTELYPLRCKTNEIEIDNSNEEEIKKTVAEAMYSCWWMLGEGKLTFLKDDAYIRPINKDIGAEKVACILCSTITFNKKVKEKNMDVNILEYMTNTKVPLKNITYWDYLTNTENSKLQTSGSAEDAGKINTGQDYAIIFLSAKGGKIGNEIARSAVPSAVFGAGLAAATGIVLTIAGVTAEVGIPMLVAGIAGLVGGTVAMSTESYLEKVRIANAYCDKDMNGCNILMLVPQNEQSFATCKHFSNIP